MAATLLLAEDSPAVQKIVQLTFAAEDIRVVAVDDGEAAIARLAEDTPDIVLAAVNLRGKDGYEIASHIKHEPRLCRVPVLLMTGPFEPIDPIRAAEAKCDGALAKPIEPPALVARVKELLQQASSSPPGHPLEDYFEKLDAAFARLAPSSERQSGRDEATAPTGEDWASADQLPSFLTPTGRSAVPASDLPGPISGDRVPPSVVPLPARGSIVPPAASKADRSLPIGMEEFIDGVAERVLERLSDRVVREKAAELVPAVAERIVREELDRIKAAIRNL
jgi:DNA-binding response OmpR family regulator